MVKVTASVAWETESPFLIVDYEPRDDLGAPTLKHLATKKILSDQRNLEEHHFRHVPWAMAEHLWQYLVRSGKRTLHMWIIFCTVYPDQFRQVCQHCKSAVRTPCFPLAAYIDLVHSPDCSWATSLNVWTEYALVPELVKLANLTNLVALEINTPTTAPDTHIREDKEVTTMNDRVIRSWCELAETSRAFQHLRILRLFYQRDLTGQSFCYLAKLPSLEFCVVAMCGSMTERSARKMARSQGWFVENQDETKLAMCQFSRRDSSKAFDGQKEWHTHHSDDLIPPSLPRDTPLLEFSVGQRRERLRDSDVIVFRRDLLAKRRHKRSTVDAASSQRGNAAQKKAKKTVMKQRTKDLSGMLAEFV